MKKKREMSSGVIILEIVSEKKPKLQNKNEIVLNKNRLSADDVMIDFVCKK